MAETDILPEFRLWTPEGFRDDVWQCAETLATGQRTILPVSAYLQLDETIRCRRREEIGVELQPADEIAIIEHYLGLLPMIALVFPAFSDGRSFSKAELLRSRCRYQGKLRATGEVLIDQIPLMMRTGFDEFLVSNETALKRLAARRLNGLPNHYQPAARHAARPARTYSWRRWSA